MMLAAAREEGHLGLGLGLKSALELGPGGWGYDLIYPTCGTQVEHFAMGYLENWGTAGEIRELPEPRF
jgi:hypothetical protein